MEIHNKGNNIEIHGLKIQPTLQTAKESKDHFSELLKATLEKIPDHSEQPGPDPVEYIVKSGDSLWKIAQKFSNKDPYQIAKENGLSNPDLIYPGQKLLIYPSAPKPAPTLESDVVTASWYGAEHHNKITASGERYNMYNYTLAHKSLPFGTRVRLENPENGKVAEGVVNDRGPFIKGRDVDTSYALAKKLGFVRKGVTKLNIEII